VVQKSRLADDTFCEAFGYLLLQGADHRNGIRRLSDRPTDNQMVGTGSYGTPGSHHSLLVVGRPVAAGANAGSNQQESVAEAGPQACRFKT
jgi:hypothetical protein